MAWETAIDGKGQVRERRADDACGNSRCPYRECWIEEAWLDAAMIACILLSR